MQNIVIGAIVAIVLLALILFYYTSSSPAPVSNNPRVDTTPVVQSPVEVTPVATPPVVPTPVPVVPAPTPAPVVVVPTPDPVVVAPPVVVAQPPPPPPPQPARTYQYADGVPLAGGSGMLGPVGGTTSWQQCQARCDAVDNCTGFWYSPIASGGNCYWQSGSNLSFSQGGIMGAYAGIRIA